MWPWEHAAVGYLGYSIARRSLGLAPPGAVELLAVVAGTQLPDLVDKPLSWGIGVFPSGYAAGHSVLVALPLGLVVLGIAASRGRLRVGAAFTLGYWSHLVGDVLDPLRFGRSPDLGRVLWPVTSATPYERDLGLGRGLVYLEEFLAGVVSMDPAMVFVQVVALPLVTVGVWLLDGAPGVSVVVDAVRAR